MKAKLIALDLDGTTLNSHHEITSEVKDILQQKRKEGVHIVLCTGRAQIGVKPLLDELGFDSDNDYVITFNGALTQRVKSGEILTHHTLDIDDFYKFAIFSKKAGVHLHTEDQTALYTFNKDISEYTVYESYLTGMPVKYRSIDEMPKDMIISKMMMIDKPELLDVAIDKIPAEFYDKYELVKSMPFFFEILNKQATKGNALKDLATFLNIKQDEVMAIGDHMNDLSMLEYANLSVAMGNAIPEAKKIAKYTTKTNDEHGVAYAIKKWG